MGRRILSVRFYLPVSVQPRLRLASSMTWGGRRGPPQPASVPRARRGCRYRTAIMLQREGFCLTVPRRAQGSRNFTRTCTCVVCCTIPQLFMEEARGHLTVQWTTRMFISCCFILMQRAADASVCAFPRAAETLLGFLQRVIVYTWFL